MELANKEMEQTNGALAEIGRRSLLISGVRQRRDDERRAGVVGMTWKPIIVSKEEEAVFVRPFSKKALWVSSETSSAATRSKSIRMARYQDQEHRSHGHAQDHALPILAWRTCAAMGGRQRYATPARWRWG